MKFRFFLLLSLVTMVSGCSSTLNSAPVVDRGVGKNTANQQVVASRSKSSVTQNAPAESPLSTELTQMKWVWPVAHYKSAVFHKEKKGLQIEVVDNVTVSAAAPGTVTYVGDSLKGYGHMVVIKHSPNVLSVYANNQQILVKEGQLIKAGEPIAKLTHEVSQPNPVLHFEIRFKGKPVNPARLLTVKAN